MTTRSRTAFLWLIPAAALALAACSLLEGPRRSSTPRELSRRLPNVLVFVTDDQRAQDTLVAMPQTRRWFRGSGTRFDNAFATTPVCCPARASIFTGRYAHNHNTLTNEDGEAAKLDQSTTLQRYLDDAGYLTALIGRYLNGYPEMAAPPHFDRYARCGCPYNKPAVNMDGSLRDVPGYSAHFMTRWVLDRLRESERRDGQPWFVYVAPKAPHIPARPERRYRRAGVPRPKPNPATREADVSDKPSYVAQSAANPAPSMPIRQLRTLLSIDDMVGRVAAALRSLDEERRTLAFFVSDNGYLWGEHGMRGKGVPYGPSMRVPLLVRWPERIDRPRVSRGLVANIDIAPTVMDVAGLDPATPMDGRSLLDRSARDRLLLEMFGSKGHSGLQWSASVTRRDIYVEYRDHGGATSEREYYDLRADPWQLENLLGDASRANDPPLRALSSRLRTDESCAGASCP